MQMLILAYRKSAHSARWPALDLMHDITCMHVLIHMHDTTKDFALLELLKSNKLYKVPLSNKQMFNRKFWNMGDQFSKNYTGKL